MAVALGPPEVIAQLENAAKVLMVSPQRPSPLRIRGPRAGPAAPGLASRWAGGQQGLSGALQAEEAAVAWRRILRPAFLLPSLPPYPALSPFPRCLTPRQVHGIWCCRKEGFLYPPLVPARRPADWLESEARGAGRGHPAGLWGCGLPAGESVSGGKGWPRPGADSSPALFLHSCPQELSLTCTHLSGDRSRQHVEGPAGGREGKLWDQGHWGETV